MRPPEPIPPERLEELHEFGKAKWSIYEFKRFLCLWLRAESGLSTEAIAKAVKWNVNTVRLIQKDFIRRGVPALIKTPRGGRYHALMSTEEEKAFLSGFEKSGAKGILLTVENIKKKLEEKLGKPVHASTVYRILERNGWRKIDPRPHHAKRNAEAAEAFKKGALANG